jgi:hypothetical protein
MTEKEWLDIGYDKNIIDVQAYEEITFYDVYKQWFLMKLKRIKEQSCDRIEVTFNKYYANDPIIEKYISKISTISIVIRYERHLPVRSMIMVFRHVLFLISWGIVCYQPQRIVIYCLGLKTM